MFLVYSWYEKIKYIIKSEEIPKIQLGIFIYNIYEEVTAIFFM